MTINARDLMIPSSQIATLPSSSTMDQARVAGGGKAATLVLDENGNLLGVAGARAARMTRGSDLPLREHLGILSPIALTAPDTGQEVLYRNLGRSTEMWHAVVEHGVFLGMIPPGRLSIAVGGETFGNLELPFEWLCCQGSPRHCFDAIEAIDLGVGPMDKCPMGDGTPLLLQTAGQP